MKRALRIWLLTSNQTSLCDFLGKTAFNMPVMTMKRMAPETATTRIHKKRAMLSGFLSHCLDIFTSEAHLISLILSRKLLLLELFPEREASSSLSSVVILLKPSGKFKTLIIRQRTLNHH